MQGNKIMLITTIDTQSIEMLQNMLH